MSFDRLFNVSAVGIEMVMAAVAAAAAVTEAERWLLKLQSLSGTGMFAFALVTLEFSIRGARVGNISHNSLVSAMVCDVIPARIRISAAPFSDFMALELACQPFRYPDGVFLVLWKNTNRASGPD